MNLQKKRLIIRLMGTFLQVIQTCSFILSIPFIHLFCYSNPLLSFSVFHSDPQIKRPRPGIPSFAAAAAGISLPPEQILDR